MNERVDIRVAIIDDDDALRDALIVLIAAAGWHAAPYANAETFLASLDIDTAGCALVDIGLPGMSGMDLFRKLNDVAPGFPVVILTGHGDVPMAVEAVKGGAVDFIEKPFDPDRLLASLRLALNKSALTSDARATLEEFNVKSSKLTPREHEVMDIMVLGLSNKLIATKLGISPRTVEIYRARVMDKMEVKSLPELVRLTLQIPQAH